MRVDVPVRRWLAAVLMAMGATYASAQAPAAPGETEEAPKVDEARVIAERAVAEAQAFDVPEQLRHGLTD